jgi:protein-glucosylgalactosylhydroxylysine glucosidase
MSSNDELSIKITYLEILLRQPTEGELATDLARLQNNEITIASLKVELENSVEFQKLQGTYGGDLTYNDAEYKLTLTDVFDKNYFGATIANGKLALITSPVHNKMDKAFITTNFDFNSVGRYNNNVVETFKYTTIHLATRNPDGVAIENHIQELNMRSGVFKVTYDSTDNTTSSPPAAVQVKNEILTLRQYPYCVMHTVTLRTTQTQTVTLFHDLETPDSIIDVKYSNNLITTIDDNNQTKGIYFFTANGVLKELSKQITSSSCYVFEDESAYQNKGYNILRSNINVAYNKFELSLTANTDFVFHIFTSTLSQIDFNHPDIEANRILINVVSKTPSTIRTENLAEWNTLWASNMILEGKDAITSNEADTIDGINRFIKFSLYNIYSVIRDDVNVEVNPLNLSTIDLNGHIFWSGELWLIPILLLIRPKAAKTLLDFRFNQLEKAKKLAAAHGYRGSKFAYENDTVGYNDVYWDTVSPLYIFNTGLISISVWNYYRVTRDLDWLKRRGYEILKSNADFFVSKLEKDPSDGKYHMYNVLGMNNVSGSDNALTNYVAKLAIKYAIEATYEINYFVDLTWRAVVENIFLPVASTISDSIASPAVDYNNILKRDAEFTGSDTMKLLEPLIPLLPFYSREFFGCSTSYGLQTLIDNHLFYSEAGRVEPAFATNAINELIQANVLGTIAQQVADYSDKESFAEEFYAKLQSVSTNAVLSPWQTFTNSLFKRSYNDISVSALFILNLLTSVGGLRILGGITEARFYYEEFGIRSRTANVMPKTWKQLDIQGIGHNASSSFNIINALYYP